MLEVSALQKKLAGQTILRDVSLSATAGDVVLITGSNGAGKSTLLKILASVLVPDRGTFNLDGLTDPQSGAWKRQVAWVPQTPALDEQLSVRDNLRFWSSFAALPRQDIKESLKQACQDPLIADFLDKRVANLSGGMKNRANLMAAIFLPAKLVLLDEPFAGADHASCQIMVDKIKQMAAAGKIILCVSHDLQYIEPVATQQVILEEGKIHQA